MNTSKHHFAFHKRSFSNPSFEYKRVNLLLILFAIIFISACNTTDSGKSKLQPDQFLQADINGERMVFRRNSDIQPLADLITDEGEDRLSISVDSISFPYVFFIGLSVFPPEGVYDTTYVIQDFIYNFEDAYANVAELDWDVFISQYKPVEGEENVLNIRNSIMDDGRMQVEGSFYMTMAWDTSYQNSGSVVVNRKFTDTLSITNGEFKAVVEDLR